MAFTFDQPDFETQNSTIYKGAIDNSIGAMSRIAAMFAPHESDPADMYIHVDAGDLLVSGALVSQALQTTPIIVAPTGNPRIDRVVIDSVTGVRSVVTGAEAAPPIAPAIPSGKLPICQILLDNSPATTAITNDLITDERVMGSGGGGEEFPIGSIYKNIGINPTIELGYGTWTYHHAGMSRFLPRLYDSELVNLIGTGDGSLPWADSTYVKATSSTASYLPVYAVNPDLTLLGAGINKSWKATSASNQRFHLALPNAQIVRGFYYENYIQSGGYAGTGVKDFTFQGSNIESGTFDDLVYANDGGWTGLTCIPTQLAAHVSADEADPQYVVVTNTIPYKYYAIKCQNSWGDSLMGLRRIVLLGDFSWIRVT